MIILIGACLATVVALALLATSFVREAARDMTRPLGIFALILAVALFVLYAIQ